VTLERARTWVKVDPTPRAIETAPERITVADAAQAFLAKCKSRNITPNTVAKYRTFTNQLSAYCAGRGYVYIE
jgi:hypothetical protein